MTNIPFTKTWNLTPLFKSDTDPLIAKERKQLERQTKKFAKKWGKRKDYLQDPHILKQALDEYEVLSSRHIQGGKEGFYFWLRSQQNQNDTKIKAKLNQIEMLSTELWNTIQFFELSLAKLDKKTADELDLLLRKRKVYASLIKSMRVFISSNRSATTDEKNEFLSSYDECCLWAPDEVLDSIGEFLDISIEDARTNEQIDQTYYKKTYTRCIEEIRKDSGFKDTSFKYRFVSFN